MGTLPCPGCSQRDRRIAELEKSNARLPATNYRGEQALKVPIVNRKVWGGNRTPDGAEAQVVNASVIATCKNRLRSAIRFISQAVCGFVGSLFTTTVKG